MTGRTRSGATARDGAQAPVEHPRHRLGEVVHQPVRFSILAALAGATEAEFGFVRDTVQVTDSTLSKQVAVLEQAGFVQVRKGYVGKRPRTWLRITPAGRSAFSDHLETLRQIAGHAAGTPPP